ncbi:hypothetical protein H6P1_00795 (plasmid) [Variovorax sp. PBL-H6]|nr:hypothetical protein SRS16P1_00139 [Variovorax sp. SRS16]VTU41875.1 hypothetical protein E5P1_00139 [Variovorax sp. PBL-E5]VTU44579.1 hypothetical protein H6P1_00795 [Variovorax sp. PBL-H6]
MRPQRKNQPYVEEVSATRVEALTVNQGVHGYAKWFRFSWYGGGRRFDVEG